MQIISYYLLCGVQEEINIHRVVSPDLYPGLFKMCLIPTTPQDQPIYAMMIMD